MSESKKKIIEGKKEPKQVNREDKNDKLKINGTLDDVLGMSVPELTIQQTK
ncbi:hypothetical protein SAMN04487765_1359 [Tenacibaculum sp. MAR_2010_89]|uniref:hypothetical protein n=1 Tax=Tenacibaculum sp. MAR_2010_89 TaxID=1250198 RepID=UPI000894F30F|nr:hypothetical protein [Tenacibaculum sp. MAR_2010_89]SEE09044.1 hypothetical protein SAMN04487765_1359 [Tenacibaculum sp. MAR_2010_89]